jgi:4-oxalocrotonate tautomerase
LPIVEIKIIEGRSSEVKRKLVKDVTAAVAQNLDVPIEKVRILLYEIPADNWNVGGNPINLPIEGNQN